ncbi:MAG: 2'-5' RNA ligase family protein [Chitinophagales bacterium]|nr:2'-5' RNA ligase family protein [Chitinophagales bacterium]MDW8273626.1 2'-5' RNA ligase family protein [Chitinophagales bacterium]
MPVQSCLYYVAVVCPFSIDVQISAFKKWMQERYGCKHALKSPAHITLIPPFRCEPQLENNLKALINEVNDGLMSFDVIISGFGCFGKRVIYAEIKENSQLSLLHQLSNKIFSEIIFDNNRSFRPHITIATRDIPESSFEEALKHFLAIDFQTSFCVENVSLLKLIAGKWNVIHPL